MARSLRLLALAGVLASALLWLAPALVLPHLAPRLAAARGIELALDGARPIFPWGVSSERARVTRGGRTLELSDLRARWSVSGARLEARVGAGQLMLRFDERTLRSGFLRAEAVPLEALDGLLPGPLALRGPLDGLYRFGARETLEASVSRGAAVLHLPLALELPFAQLVVAAEREPDGGWRVALADLRGPPLSATASGRIGASGELELRLVVAELEEPARSAFASAGLATGPLPYSAEIGGTLALPRFSPASPEPR